MLVMIVITDLQPCCWYGCSWSGVRLLMLVAACHAVLRWLVLTTRTSSSAIMDHRAFCTKFWLLVQLSPDRLNTAVPRLGLLFGWKPGLNSAEYWIHFRARSVCAILPISVSQISQNLNTTRRWVSQWILSEHTFENFLVMGSFSKKRWIFFDVLRLQAAITPQWLY